MKPIYAFVLGAVFVGCHLDKLVSGGGGPTSTAPPAHIVFTTPPQTAPIGQKLTPAVRVSLVDSAGVPVGGFDTTTVVVALGANPGSATLQGTKSVHPVRGVATFADLWLDQPGTGYTLTASARGLDTVSTLFNITPPPPTTGSITVTTSTTGLDLDLDGYTVTVDGSTSQSIATNDGNGVTFPGLSAGNHSVALSSVASNCSVTGVNPRTASVTAGQTASVAFSVTCTAIPPTTGDLTVTSNTSGADLDPDGYTVTVDQATSKAIATTSGSATFPALPAGNHSVALSGVASNCTVSGANPRTVNVVAGTGASTAFAVTCTATTGDLVVTTTTGGSDLDPDGYTVSAAGTSQSILTNGSVTFSGVQAGTQNVALSGIASNCTVTSANPLSVNVPAGGTGHADFAISCVAPQNHAPVVNAGPDQQVLLSVLTLTLSGASFSDVDHNGPWQVTIDWGDGHSTSFAQPSEGTINGSHTYSDLLPADHTLTITVQDAGGATGTASKTVHVT